MRFLIAVTLPVWLFVFQLWLCIELNLNQLIPVYVSFLVFYCLGSVIGLSFRPKRVQETGLTPRFLIVSKLFIWLKIILTFYFLLIFIEYVVANGYDFVRGYFTGEDIKNSRFYFALFMYIDAYIVVPLNFIFLSIFLLSKEKRLAIILVFLLVLQYVVIYAGRMAIYNFTIFAIFFLIYKRVSFFKIIWKIMPFLAIGIVASLVLVFSRDNTYILDGGESINNAASFSILNYHVVPPMILNNLIEKSVYFNSGNGFGLATFGFVVDPIISIFTIGDSKRYLVSKLLSAEVQNFVFNLDGQDYNAFATFLYIALFDFGFIGPCLYGIFFGFLISYTYRRGDLIGGACYVVISFFVYFNAFTFFITGEWFFVLLIAPFAFRRKIIHDLVELRTSLR